LGAYKDVSLVNAEIPEGSVPVSAFSLRSLITHTEDACRRDVRQHRRPPQKWAGGAHSRVSAVSAEMLAGTLPTRPRFSVKYLQPGTVR
jgi:hypothetical protein